MEKKVTVRIENEEESIETYSCAAAIGFVFDTEDDEKYTADAAFFVGRGNVRALLIKAAIQLGTLARQALDNEIDAGITGLVMSKELTKAAFGEPDDKAESVNIERKKVKEVKEES